jgi:hypothetical protein
VDERKPPCTFTTFALGNKYFSIIVDRRVRVNTNLVTLATEYFYRVQKLNNWGPGHIRVFIVLCAAVVTYYLTFLTPVLAPVNKTDFPALTHLFFIF